MIGAQSLSRRRGSAGFSLIEVMIALVVLALGLLGFALLQTMNLRYTQSANYRTVATNLAYDLLDQMRANRLSADEYNAATFAVGDAPVGAACTRHLGTPAIAGTNGIIERWQCQVVEALGDQASAGVQYDRVSGLATVVINWSDRVTSDPHTSFEVETYL